MVGWYLAKLPSDSSASATRMSPLPACPPSSVVRPGLDKAADGVAWIGTGVHQNVGQHGAGGGLPCAPATVTARFAVHEQGEDVTAMHNALARRVCCDDFRIVRFDGAGVDHGLGLGDIFGSLPEFNGDAQRFSRSVLALCARSEPSTATPSACSISARRSYRHRRYR